MFRGIGNPLALTTAISSNSPSAVEVSEFRAIWDRISAIFNGGKLQYNNSASTIVALSESETFQIVRKGTAYGMNFNISKSCFKNKY